MEFIQEQLSTPVRESYDVIVVGGGVAGISAALAAARSGARVLLAERGFMLGGLATAGLVTIYLPLCDGRGKQVSYGLAEELLRLSASMGVEADYPDAWLGDRTEKRAEQRFMLRYNAQLFALLAEEALIQSGVTVRYGLTLAGVDCRNDRVYAAIFEEKGGRYAARAHSYVDATGDADVFHLSNAPTRAFRQGNVLAAWYYSAGRDGVNLNPLGFCDVPDERRDELGTPELLVNRRFRGLDGAELSEMVCAAHAQVLGDVRRRRENDPELSPVTLSTIPQVRMTRCIVGEYILRDDENDVCFSDGIGRIADWRRRGYVYEIPYRALYSAKLKNVIAAGRCISATDAMWDVTRVIPVCAVTGEAAGTAAAMTDDFAVLDSARLRTELRRKCDRPDIAD